MLNPIKNVITLSAGLAGNAQAFYRCYLSNQTSHIVETRETKYNAVSLVGRGRSGFGNDAGEDLSIQNVSSVFQDYLVADS